MPDFDFKESNLKQYKKYLQNIGFSQEQAEELEKMFCHLRDDQKKLQRNFKRLKKVAYLSPEEL